MVAPVTNTRAEYQALTIAAKKYGTTLTFTKEELDKWCETNREKTTPTKAFVKDTSKDITLDNIIYASKDTVNQYFHSHADTCKRMCNKCKQHLLVSDFAKDNGKWCGRVYRCKPCRNAASQTPEARKEQHAKALAYRRSYKGCKKDIYHHIKCYSRERGHNKPNFTFKEFDAWLEKNGYRYRYSTWKNSEYAMDNKPSVDRLDSTKGYTFDNMQLVTFKKNLKYAATRDIVNKSSNADNYGEVEQYNKDMKLVRTFKNVTEAYNLYIKPHGGNRNDFTKSIGGKYTHLGCYWKYKNPPVIDRRVVQLTDSDDFIAIHPSCRQAALSVGLNNRAVNRVVRTKRNKAGGYKWMMATDYIAKYGGIPEN